VIGERFAGRALASPPFFPPFSKKKKKKKDQQKNTPASSPSSFFPFPLNRRRGGQLPGRVPVRSSVSSLVFFPLLPSLPLFLPLPWFRCFKFRSLLSLSPSPFFLFFLRRREPTNVTGLYPLGFLPSLHFPHSPPPSSFPVEKKAPVPVGFFSSFPLFPF